MSVEFVRLYKSIRQWAQLRSIQTEDCILPAGKAGEFNGVSVFMNRDYEVEERAYYLLHALGSIVAWSLDKIAVQELFTELDASKRDRMLAAQRLEEALKRYREFEDDSSQFGAGILNDIRFPEFIASYSNFMRADLEALTEFHRHGRAPVWRQFFSHWNDEIAAGRREPILYSGKLIPKFYRTQIATREILQQQ